MIGRRTPGFGDHTTGVPLSRSRPMGWGVAASLVLHGALVALLLSGLVKMGHPLPEDAPIPVELAFLEEIEPEAIAEEELAEPEPIEEEFAEEPEPVVEEEIAEEEPEPIEEEEVAEEPEPEPVEEEEFAEEEPEPIEEEEVAEEPEPELVEEQEVAEEEPELLEEEVVAEEPELEPIVEEEIAEELEPEPVVEEEIAEEAPPEPVEEEIAVEPEPEPVVAEEPSVAPPLPELTELAPPPLPPRRPLVAQEEPPPEAPAEEPLPEELAEAPPEPEPAPEPESSYVRVQDINRPPPDQFLANLAALQDEDAQALKNPELWEVIRAVRAQIEMCWLLDRSEARNPKLAVDIAVAFDRGGGVTKAEIQQVGQMVLDEDYKAFATKAHGALMACSPFALPPDKYAIWQSFTMRFVPRNRG